MTGQQLRADLAAYPTAKYRVMQRGLVLVAAAFLPWLAIVLMVRNF